MLKNLKIAALITKCSLPTHQVLLPHSSKLACYERAAIVQGTYEKYTLNMSYYIKTKLKVDCSSVWGIIRYSKNSIYTRTESFLQPHYYFLNESYNLSLFKSQVHSQHLFIWRLEMCKKSQFTSSYELVKVWMSSPLTNAK